MKIKLNTPDHLILDHTPWGYSLLFLMLFLISLYVSVGLPLQGNVLALMGLPFPILFFLLLRKFAQRSQAVFDSVKGVVTFRHRSLSNHIEREFPLSDVDQATVEVSYSRRTDTEAPPPVFHPVLHIKGVKEPLTQLSMGTFNPEDHVDQINRWLEDYRASKAV